MYAQVHCKYAWNCRKPWTKIGSHQLASEKHQTSKNELTWSFIAQRRAFMQFILNLSLQGKSLRDKA